MTGPVRDSSLLPPPQAIGDEIITIDVTSETSAVPDEPPKMSDPLKVLHFILVFNLAIYIWGSFVGFDPYRVITILYNVITLEALYFFGYLPYRRVP